MSRRVIILSGMLVIAIVEAQAVNAPATVDTRTIDPREDLFAPKPRAVAPVGTPAVAPPPAVRSIERVPSGNPLWAIPLGQLTASREHPLFAKTRRPPAPPVAAVAMPVVMPVAAPSKPVEAEKPQISLLGTIAGREKIGLFIESASKNVVRLKAGESHKGWFLRDVRPRQVELVRGLDSAVLELPAPDIKGGGGPVLTAAMPGPTIPVTPAPPVNAATVPGGLPGPPPPGFGQPLVFPPPLPQINPFPKGRL